MRAVSSLHYVGVAVIYTVPSEQRHYRAIDTKTKIDSRAPFTPTDIIGVYVGSDALKIYIVTDLINALPGNSSINTVQDATIDEAVFYVVRGEQRWKNGVIQPVSKQRLGKHFRVSGDVSNNRDGVFRGVCAECL
jgi:hypothetical protein